MASLLEQLGNEQAMLMHLAGELPAEDAAELETMLKADPRLAQEAQSLREAQEHVFASLDLLDRLESPPATEAMAMRGVRRRLNLQAIEPDLAENGSGASKSALRYPWWTYPVATAAAVLLAFLVWWGNSDYSPHWLGQNTQTAWNAGDMPTGGAGMGRRMRMEMDPSLREAYMEARQKWLGEWLAASFSGDDTAAEPADSPLSQAEEQVASLSQADQQVFPPLVPGTMNQ
jgi:hypothetical protein